MTQLKHTPGPWTVGDSGHIYDDDAREVALPLADSEEQYRANARLIAAAPEMLAALQHTLATLSEAENDGFFSVAQANEIRLRARAAIAKATGEQ